MDRYPPIAEHGLIGDLQTAALVTTDGTVDWWCCPRFDSPSVFASLFAVQRCISTDLVRAWALLRPFPHDHRAWRVGR
jgi:GH15 family glucan-1,4-alpha-glucosidase